MNAVDQTAEIEDAFDIHHRRKRDPAGSHQLQDAALPGISHERTAGGQPAIYPASISAWSMFSRRFSTMNSWRSGVFLPM